ncbi:heme o synthase [Coxiella endosymbiont of Rhipicephalus microplus]|uniref:heme o synthase n=1 Tax=Coxiella endosymbiont of Rhipicephalus microplus TaxID=1656186 RepID=UPI000C7F904D|nr:heme o synthase [Coxiella endosymbiont of Rhipicephalus microplus]PMB54875.1 Heme A synthase, cytochrome oxidase biogenesis protein Cox15-CtaA [Coxiella-like endosymbiont]
MKTDIKIAPLIQIHVTWRDYLKLCKPGIVLLIILTALVGMCLSSPGIVSWRILLFGNLGIALAASSSAALNQILEQHLDKLMHRTSCRPIVQGRISRQNAIIFAIILSVFSMAILISFVNLFTALLTFATLISYAGIYTLYLKNLTSQNIVIGGLAGATPPLLGGVAVTGHINLSSVILFLIIFIWTPPHFWALAIHRIDDYAKANIPMLPNTHGIPYTKLNILFYTLLLAVISSGPFLMGISGWIYFSSVCFLNLGFIYWAIRLFVSNDSTISIRVFRYSILYLMLLFTTLLIDHYFN